MNQSKPKIIRMTTIPISMNSIMKGQLRYMSAYFEIIGVSKYVKKDFDEISSREGIQMHSIPLHRTINPLKDLISLFAMISFLRKEKPFIIHTHTPKAGLIGMLAGFLMRTPIRIHTVAGMPLMESKGAKRLILFATEWLTYQLAHRIYPNSAGLSKFITGNNLAHTSKIKVIGRGSSNGINLNHFKRDYDGSTSSAQIRLNQRSSLGLNETDFVYIFIGRLVIDKGIVELLEAFEQMCTLHKNIKLLLLGPLETAHNALSDEVIQKIKKHSNIVYPGRTDEIRPYLIASDCFVFPSYREGFPSVLLQAGAMEVPIIASNIIGNNELISNGIDGYLFEPKTVEGLNKAMLRIYYDSNESKKEFANRMLLKIQQNFANEIIWEELKKEYDNHLQTRTGAKVLS